MAGTVANTTVAGLQNQLATALGTLGSLGVTVPGATAATGGGTAAATTPATGTAATPNATPGVETPIAGKRTPSGTAITVLKSEKGYRLQTPTNQFEIVEADGKILRFDAQGKQTRAFEVVDRSKRQIALDYREGIAAGIANMSRLVAARQERTKEMSDALATDANDNGTINQVDLQRLVQENTTTENITSLQKKIYDAVDGSVKTWLR